MKSGLTLRVPLLVLLLALLVLPASGVGAAETKGKGAPGDFPLHITAARLEADQQAKIITFLGQVRAQYGDSILYADQLKVYYQASPARGAPAPTGAPSPGPKPEEKSPLADLGGEKIDRIVATGQVRFVQEDRVATGQEATYYKDREEVVLLGHPQLWRGENSLKGERIIFNLRDNRLKVESSPQQRVEANLYPATSKAPGAKPTLPGTKPRKPGKPREGKP
jgi:lipopolysaccharide export system protein LptA